MANCNTDARFEARIAKTIVDRIYNIFSIFQMMLLVTVFLWIFSLPIACIFAIFFIPVGTVIFAILLMISSYIQWKYENDIIVHSPMRNLLKSFQFKKWFPSYTCTGKEPSGLLICHPHGILCCGMLLYHLDHDTVFAVAPIVFHIPIIGWVARSAGFIPATEYMMCRALKKNIPVILMVGGIEEMLCHDKKQFYLEKRYGYLRIAQDTITPVYVHNEFETFYSPSMPYLEYRQWLSRKMGFGIMFPWIFGHCGSWLPKQVPLSVHVGDPLTVRGSLTELKGRYHWALCDLVSRVTEEEPQAIACHHSLTLPIRAPSQNRPNHDLD